MPSIKTVKTKFWSSQGQDPYSLKTCPNLKHYLYIFPCFIHETKFRLWVFTLPCIKSRLRVFLIIFTDLYTVKMFYHIKKTLLQLSNIAFCWSCEKLLCNLIISSLLAIRISTGWLNSIKSWDSKILWYYMTTYNMNSLQLKALVLHFSKFCHVNKFPIWLHIWQFNYFNVEGFWKTHDFVARDVLEALFSKMSKIAKTLILWILWG